MQLIQPTNVITKSHSAALNALAVNKRSYPFYFYISAAAKVVTESLTANKLETSLTIETGSGLVAGDYFRLGVDHGSMEDEIFYLKGYTTSDTVMAVKRAQLGTEAGIHAASLVAFKRQDGFVNTQLGAGTAVIAESRTVWDLGDASFYDCNLEVQCVSGTADADEITLTYAFSGFDDVTIATIETEMTNMTNTLACTYVTGDTVYFSTGNFKPTARYMYLWVIGHAGLDDANTTAKIRLNTV